MEDLWGYTISTDTISADTMDDDYTIQDDDT